MLYVFVKRALGLPRKPLHRGRLGRRKTALRVRVAGQEKRSPTAKGEDPAFHEPLVFLLGARPHAGTAPPIVRSQVTCAVQPQCRCTASLFCEL